ncbi:MAG: hypothetical protein ACTSPS_19640 [Promethearchaeota archaeon]
MSSEEKTSRKKMLSYSMGWFIDNLVIASYGVLIFYYYEVEIGLATALVGISFVIYAIWNMVNDTYAMVEKVGVTKAMDHHRGSSVGFNLPPSLYAT